MNKTKCVAYIQQDFEVKKKKKLISVNIFFYSTLFKGEKNKGRRRKKGQKTREAAEEEERMREKPKISITAF